MGKTPRALTPFAVVDSQTLTQRTIEHNALLSNAFGDLNQSDTDINLISFDTFSLFNEIRANPTEFGFSNVTEACLNPDPKTFPVEEPTTIEVCQDPSKYVFWDGIHPTTAAHNLLAKRFQLRLEKKSESVNEPNFSAALGLLSITWLVRFIFNFINKKSLKP